MSKISEMKCPRCLRIYDGIIEKCPWCGCDLNPVKEVAETKREFLEFNRPQNKDTLNPNKARTYSSNVNNNNNFLNWTLDIIPGFRSRKIWKMILGSMYYIFCLLMLFGGFYLFLFLASIPFIIFDLIGGIKNRSLKLLTTSFTAIVFLSYSYSTFSNSALTSKTNPQNISAKSSNSTIQNTKAQWKTDAGRLR